MYWRNMLAERRLQTCPTCAVSMQQETVPLSVKKSKISIQLRGTEQGSKVASDLIGYTSSCSSRRRSSATFN